MEHLLSPLTESVTVASATTRLVLSDTITIGDTATLHREATAVAREQLASQYTRRLIFSISFSAGCND